MYKILGLLAGMAGASVAAQYPEFAQQYTQRLAGQVDALAQVVSDFDTSALASGMTRQAALQQMTGTAFLEARARDMTVTFARHSVLSAHLVHLQDAGPIARMTMPHRMADPATLRATWADYQPALPLSAAGAVAGAGGFLGGWALIGGLLALLFRRPARRPESRPRTAAPRPRQDPPLRRPDTPAASPRRTLMGETRP